MPIGISQGHGERAESGGLNLQPEGARCRRSSGKRRRPEFVQTVPVLQQGSATVAEISGVEVGEPGHDARGEPQPEAHVSDDAVGRF